MSSGTSTTPDWSLPFPSQSDTSRPTRPRPDHKGPMKRPSTSIGVVHSEVEGPPVSDTDKDLRGDLTHVKYLSEVLSGLVSKPRLPPPYRDARSGGAKGLNQDVNGSSPFRWRNNSRTNKDHQRQSSGVGRPGSEVVDRSTHSVTCRPSSLRTCSCRVSGVTANSSQIR